MEAEVASEVFGVREEEAVKGCFLMRVVQAKVAASGAARWVEATVVEMRERAMASAVEMTEAAEVAAMVSEWWVEALAKEMAERVAVAGEEV
mmetsp:Transcript_28762/g.70061  ORF Transcript_28762/g.70061 Transcript_28762/m.70061 type:complete len:92 (+) Transcript_28762:246-521(+)